jgi:hypothetical protein
VSGRSKELSRAPSPTQLVAVPPSATRLRPFSRISERRIQTVEIHQHKRNENSFLEETRSNPSGLVQAQEGDERRRLSERWYGQGTLADFRISSGRNIRTFALRSRDRAIRGRCSGGVAGWVGGPGGSSIKDEGCSVFAELVSKRMNVTRADSRASETKRLCRRY